MVEKLGGDDEFKRSLNRNILSVLNEAPLTSIASGDVNKALNKANSPSSQRDNLTKVRDLLDLCVQANAVESMNTNVTDKLTVQDVLKVFKEGKRGLQLNSKEVKGLESRAQTNIGHDYSTRSHGA